MPSSTRSVRFLSRRRLTNGVSSKMRVGEVPHPGDQTGRHRHRFDDLLAAVQVILPLIGRGGNGMDVDVVRIVWVLGFAQHHEHRGRRHGQRDLVGLDIGAVQGQRQGGGVILDGFAILTQQFPMRGPGPRQNRDRMPGVFHPAGDTGAAFQHDTDRHLDRFRRFRVCHRPPSGRLSRAQYCLCVAPVKRSYQYAASGFDIPKGRIHRHGCD